MGLFMRLNAQNCRDNLKRLETYRYAQKAKKERYKINFQPRSRNDRVLFKFVQFGPSKKARLKQK
jgi:hypothetical protein